MLYVIGIVEFWWRGGVRDEKGGFVFYSLIIFCDLISFIILGYELEGGGMVSERNFFVLIIRYFNYE